MRASRGGRGHRGPHGDRAGVRAQVAVGVDCRDLELVVGCRRQIRPASAEAPDLAEEGAVAIDAVADHARAARAGGRPRQPDRGVRHARDLEVAGDTGRPVASHDSKGAAAPTDTATRVGGRDGELDERRAVEAHPGTELAHLPVDAAVTVDAVAVEVPVAGPGTPPLEPSGVLGDLAHGEPPRPARRVVAHPLREARRARGEPAGARDLPDREHVVAAGLHGNPDRAADGLPDGDAVAIGTETASLRPLPRRASAGLPALRWSSDRRPWCRPPPAGPPGTRARRPRRHP